MNVYCSWRWMVGCFAMLVGVALHIFCLQYMDLTLLAANAVTAIVSTLVFSIVILGEKFVCRYDLPALILISIGCSTIVMNSNKSDETYTADDVIELLLSPRTLCFTGACVFFILLSLGTLSLVLARLRRFERDVESYQEKHGLVGADLILPPRERF